MDNKVNSEDIKKLIRLGLRKRSEARGCIIDERMQERCTLLSWNNGELVEMAKKLSDDDIRLLYKGLVHVEAQIRGVSGPTASGVYNIILERDLDPTNSLADFGLRNCDNPYVPFGTPMGLQGVERTYEEYAKNHARYEKERTERWEKNIKYQNRVEGRKDRRKNALTEFRKIDHDTQNKIRAKLKKKYANASIEEKFTLMANDEKYPPEYYPIEWAMVTKEEISVIQIDLIIQIYDKLFTNVINKHWNILSKLLSEYDDASNDSLF